MMGVKDNLASHSGQRPGARQDWKQAEHTAGWIPVWNDSWPFLVISTKAEGRAEKSGPELTPRQIRGQMSRLRYASLDVIDGVKRTPNRCAPQMEPRIRQGRFSIVRPGGRGVKGTEPVHQGPGTCPDEEEQHFRRRIHNPLLFVISDSLRVAKPPTFTEQNCRRGVETRRRHQATSQRQPAAIAPAGLSLPSGWGIYWEPWQWTLFGREHTGRENMWRDIV